MTKKRTLDRKSRRKKQSRICQVQYFFCCCRVLGCTVVLLGISLIWARDLLSSFGRVRERGDKENALLRENEEMVQREEKRVLYVKTKG